MKNEHEFIEVGDRRWCVGCDLFQTRRTAWVPTALPECPRNTPVCLKLKEQKSFKDAVRLSGKVIGGEEHG